MRFNYSFSRIKQCHESANRLTEDFKSLHVSINWFRIRGFRNRIVHDYMGIDYQIVWTIIIKDLNNLESDIKAIVDKL